MSNASGRPCCAAQARPAATAPAKLCSKNSGAKKIGSQPSASSAASCTFCGPIAAR